MVGKDFRDYMKLRYEEEVIVELMRSDYLYDGPTLATFKGVQDVLLSDKMTRILCSGQSGKVMGYIISWLYQFTMECGKNWMMDAWGKYCFDRDFCFALGDMSGDCHKTGTHSVLKMIKKTASNSSITAFKRRC